MGKKLEKFRQLLAKQGIVVEEAKAKELFVAAKEVLKISKKISQSQFWEWQKNKQYEDDEKFRDAVDLLMYSKEVDAR